VSTSAVAYQVISGLPLIQHHDAAARSGQRRAQMLEPEPGKTVPVLNDDDGSRKVRQQAGQLAAVPVHPRPGPQSPPARRPGHRRPLPRPPARPAAPDHHAGPPATPGSTPPPAPRPAPHRGQPPARRRLHHRNRHLPIPRPLPRRLVTHTVPARPPSQPHPAGHTYENRESPTKRATVGNPPSPPSAGGGFGQARALRAN
jgi:hypothetical protein